MSVTAPASRWQGMDSSRNLATLAGVGALVGSGAVAIYLIASLAYAMTASGVYVRLAQAIGLGMLAVHIASPRRREWPIYAVIAIALLGFTLRLHLQQLTTASQLLHILAASGAAIGFLRNPLAPWLLRLIVVGCAAFVASRVAAGFFPESVLAGRSSNHISVLLLAPTLLCNLEEARRDRSVSAFPAVLTALASTWALGRAGIATSYLYLAGILRYRHPLGRRTVWLSLGVSAAIVIPFVLRNLFIIELWFLALFTKFRTKGFIDDPRFRIVQEYVRSLDPTAALLGPTPERVSRIGLTLHNSFLHWHFIFGAGALILAGITLLAITRAARSTRTFIAFALTVLLLRAFSDTVLLAGLFDLPFLVGLVLALGPDVSNEEHTVALSNG